MLVVAATIGASQPPLVSAIDQECRWLESVDSLGLNRQEMLLALGCSLNANGDWITGTILNDDESARCTPEVIKEYELHRALYWEGFNDIAYGKPGDVPAHHEVTVQGQTFTFGQVVMMTEKDRLKLAEAWVAEQLGLDPFCIQRASYREYVELAIPRLHDAINDMLADPRLSRVLEYDITTGDFRVGSDFLLSGSIARVVNMKGQPLFGSGDPDMYEVYETAAYTYMTMPGHEVLAQYATWYIQRRDAAVLSVTGTNAYNPVANDVLMSRGEYQQMPWPWQLADVNTITEYTIWVVDIFGP